MMRSPPLTACLIALAIPAFADAQGTPTKLLFKLDKPFTFNFGDTAEGPGGLSIWFAGVGPDDHGKTPHVSFAFKRGSRTLDQPFWSERTDDRRQPLMRGLLDGYSITVRKVAHKEPYATTLVVSRYKPAAMRWRRPITLNRREFVVDPDGTLWAFAAPAGSADAPRVRLIARKKGTADDHSAELRLGPKGTFGPEAWGDLLITARVARGTTKRPRALRLKLSKPKETFKRLKLGRPMILHPRESTRGPSGFTLTLNGYGHKIVRTGSDLLTVEVTVKQGSQEEVIFFIPSRGRKNRLGSQVWAGWSITLQACNDHGPPHSRTATSTFVVRKAH
jgi:hypothetical protein